MPSCSPLLARQQMLREAAADLLAGAQVLVLRAALQVTLAERRVQHDSRLDGQQVSQQVQALQWRSHSLLSLVHIYLVWFWA